MSLNWRTATRRLLPYMIAAAAGFLLAYLVVFLFVFPDRVVPDDGSVPGVVGLDYADAERRLAVAGYEADVGLRRFNATAPQNVVLSQSPSPGTALARGMKVTLDVSAGQRTVEVPPDVLDAGRLRVLPQRHATDGSFAARLRRAA